MVVVLVLFLVGPLLLCGPADAQSTIDTLKVASLQWIGSMTCEPWDCNCTFNQQRGCCCGANDLYQVEDDTLQRIKILWQEISTLNSRVQSLTAGVKIAFKATIDPSLAITIPGSTERCFGPFNTNVPVPFGNITLNDGRGYSPTLGVFTAPRSGVYVFSLTVYSSVEVAGRLYHKVQLIWNGRPTANVWENNREDSEDNASQVVVLELHRGDQVYVELISGRKICKYPEFNIFSGYILYPYIDE
ncbi:complement C1q tumor necrosis factor-related protein 3 [Anabas testudineus]|uniref:C1q domain-containing protein n=1 Tax=Anabas testudineus TaxID=64144 RepID=A0A3Q1JP74_ANATE|nr:complement C1q tumor necrosis factor-related protein 3 [Anabas testudineus]